MGITLKNIWGHFVTVTSHRHMVMLHCFKAGIIRRGLWHDMSKYSPTEFMSGIRYYQGGRRSPNEAEREVYGYSKAWVHHKGRNRHHFEYWTDYNPKNKMMEPVPMPLVFVKEMFCDRVAASKIYQKENYTDLHPLEYYRKGNAKKHMHPETAELLEKLLVMLADEGEDAVFKYIRELK